MCCRVIISNKFSFDMFKNGAYNFKHNILSNLPICIPDCTEEIYIHQEMDIDISYDYKKFNDINDIPHSEGDNEFFIIIEGNDILSFTISNP